MIDKNAIVTFDGPNGRVTTTISAAFIAAGLDTSQPPNKQRRIIQPKIVAQVLASTQQLAKQLASLKLDVKPSVIVNAKANKTHNAVTIYVTKELLPGSDDKTEYLCITRTRRQESGEVTPDDKQNFGFDKSYCFYRGPRTPDKSQHPGGEWMLKKVTREVGKIKGVFWSRYVPEDAAAAMLEGLRQNFSGATMVIEDQTSIL